MVKIILENRYLIRSHMNGFLLSEVKEDKEAVVLVKKIKNSFTDDYSNFTKETYHPNFPALARKIRSLELDSENVNDIEHLKEVYERTDERIANIEKYFKE